MLVITSQFLLDYDKLFFCLKLKKIGILINI